MHGGAGENGALGKVPLVPVVAGGGISGEEELNSWLQTAVFSVAVAG